jgi:hypothetical protein
MALPKGRTFVAGRKCWPTRLFLDELNKRVLPSFLEVLVVHAVPIIISLPSPTILGQVIWVLSPRLG